MKTSKKGKILISLSTAATATVSLTNGLATSANATMSFNRTGAWDIADQYWNSWPQGGDYGNKFEPFESDCTNFASYVWNLGGGVPMTNDWYIDRYAFIGRTYARAWINVVSFYQYWGNSGNTQWWDNDISSITNHAWTGDVIVYNWGRGEGWSHIGIEIGQGSYKGTYYDVIDQHTTNRHNSIWNLGYQQEQDPVVRSQMGGKTLHVI